jgi:Tfp pilus assembly protein PilF
LGAEADHGQRFDWTALVAFCGLAQTHPRKQVWVADWMAERVTALTMDAGISDLISALCSADEWLARFPRSDIRAISFSVAGFVGIRPFFTLISNFESLHRAPQRDRLKTSDRLQAETVRPSRPAIRLAGRPNAVRRQDKWLMLAAARAGVPPERMYEVITRVNRRASIRDRTIGRACHVSHVTLTGEWGGRVDGWPADREYMPAFVDLFGLRLRPALDEHGNAKPIQLRGMSGAGYAPSYEYFECALREKGENAETLNNYGAWLVDAKADDDGAERLYRRAIQAEPAYALAHSNLAALLWRRGDLDGAEREYQLALRAAPDELFVLVNYGGFLAHARNDSEGATQVLDRALARDRTAFVLARYAHAREALGQLDEAEALYRQALALEPNDAWAQGRFGYFLWARRHDETQAAAYIRRSVEHDSRELFNLLVAADFEMNVNKDFATARRLTRRAVRVAPRSPDALALHAVAMRHTGATLDRVERVLSEALAIDQEHNSAKQALRDLERTDST